MRAMIFNSLKDVLIEIRNKSYDRNFASVIGFEYASEENDKLIYNNLDDYSFFFHFLDIEQFDISDDKFVYIIGELLKINELNEIEVKKVLYEEQLNKIEEKYNTQVITKETYNYLKNKYLK